MRARRGPVLCRLPAADADLCNALIVNRVSFRIVKRYRRRAGCLTGLTRRGKHLPRTTGPSGGDSSSPSVVPGAANCLTVNAQPGVVIIFAPRSARRKAVTWKLHELCERPPSYDQTFARPRVAWALLPLVVPVPAGVVGGGG
ncbi:hypothetical protein HEK131_30580 [Streptomyces seoulensis]|nr:hypothetical protein HEK131_30580 [Streptomyces seoulensis]